MLATFVSLSLLTAASASDVEAMVRCSANCKGSDGNDCQTSEVYDFLSNGDISNCRKQIAGTNPPEYRDCQKSDSGCTDLEDDACYGCGWTNEGSGICHSDDEETDWDPEYCFFTARNHGENPSPTGEPTIRAAIQCTDSATYDTQAKCVMAAGCKWSSAHCNNANGYDVTYTYDTKTTCEEVDNHTWISGACGVDSTTAYTVCDSSFNLKTARFGTGTGFGCRAQVFNKDLSQTSEVRTRHLVKQVCANQSRTRPCSQCRDEDFDCVVLGIPDVDQEDNDLCVAAWNGGESINPLTNAAWNNGSMMAQCEMRCCEDDEMETKTYTIWYRA